MSLTYTNETDSLHDDAVYTPVYARGKARGKKKGVKTWMILAPVGGVVLLGGAAMMMLYPSNEAAPMTEAETPAVSAMAPIAAEPSLLDSAAPAPVTTASDPAPVSVAPTPVARDAAPVRRERPAPVRPAAETPVAERAAEIVEPTVPAGPQPYPGTAVLNTSAAPARAPMSAPATQPPAPAISVQPLN